MLARLIGIAIALAVLWFAIEGGEYGTSDLLRQRARKAKTRHDIDSLTREVDSLTRLKRAVLTDPAVQERIAREEFGMVRGDREVLYRFAPSESVKKAARP